MIEISGVSRRYGEVHAVSGVDLRVHAGEVFGLIGHNGAGKSTLFKMMLGLVAASTGEIRIAGESVTGKRFREVRRGIGYLPENVVFHDNLTGLETLAFFARLKGVPRTQCAPLLERVGLAEAGGRRVRGYSKGMRQRLGFAQALLGEPRLLFLDEPTTGLDPEGIREFYEILRALRAGGTTIVLTSHILSEIQERVGRLAIMKSGRVQACGTVQALREAAHLPLRFELELAEGDEHCVQGALHGLGLPALRRQGGTVSVDCPRASKMAVLRALSALGSQVSDLRVREPSLEDIFLGYAS
ncbi:ABC transporter ATP-binding protein [Ramlibacter alkalitolerans]|jgi:Cu-processing system ATP-binding protein|uniref:ABC transporter ATP-binding protein n=1 Tax=Ramlibacter alkalitolerans TaxID=2039631 RepID=A0ABS1JIZ9_9BURK|nr:ABC transporter ATP-binding protein [Ramlibacter alkalitolerans]MBL0424213.1 ABC transporter ATP-binding protein [Ramlibacter alkalitolerans]